MQKSYLLGIWCKYERFLTSVVKIWTSIKLKCSVTGTRMTVVTTIALFTSYGRAKNVILCLLNVSDICDGLQLIEPILVSHSFIK